MRLRAAGLLIGMLIGLLTVVLAVKAIRGFLYLPGPDDYEDATPALWSSLSPI
jgi:hypothetical protein